MMGRLKEKAFLSFAITRQTKCVQDTNKKEKREDLARKMTRDTLNTLYLDSISLIFFCQS